MLTAKEISEQYSKESIKQAIAIISGKRLTPVCDSEKERKAIAGGFSPHNSKLTQLYTNKGDNNEGTDL